MLNKQISKRSYIITSCIYSIVHKTAVLLTVPPPLRGGRSGKAELAKKRRGKKERKSSGWQYNTSTGVIR